MKCLVEILTHVQEDLLSLEDLLYKGSIIILNVQLMRYLLSVVVYGSFILILVFLHVKRVPTTLHLEEAVKRLGVPVFYGW